MPSPQTDPIRLDRSYFLEPDQNSVKAYAVLRRSLRRPTGPRSCSSRSAGKTRLGALRTRGTVLILQSLLWDDEVREAGFLDTDVRVSAQELKMAGSLIDSMATDFRSTPPPRSVRNPRAAPTALR